MDMTPVGKKGVGRTSGSMRGFSGIWVGLIGSFVTGFGGGITLGFGGGISLSFGGGISLGSGTGRRRSSEGSFGVGIGGLSKGVWSSFNGFFWNSRIAPIFHKCRTSYFVKLLII